jgi:hypothetical protein
LIRKSLTPIYTDATDFAVCFRLESWRRESGY